MFRLRPPTRRGRRRNPLLWAATAAVLAAAAAPAQADPFVYVANFASEDVTQYDVGAGGLLAPLVPPAVAAGNVPIGVAVSPDGGSVYVTNVHCSKVLRSSAVSK